MQLIQQVRSRYHRDQKDLLHREQLLYGTTSDRFRLEGQEEGWEGEDWYEEDPSRNGDLGNSARLRLAAALTGFVLVLLLDRTGRSLFGLTAEKIFDSIARDYVTEAEEAISNISVKLQP